MLRYCVPMVGKYRNSRSLRIPFKAHGILKPHRFSQAFRTRRLNTNSQMAPLGRNRINEGLVYLRLTCKGAADAAYLASLRNRRRTPERQVDVLATFWEFDRPNKTCFIFAEVRWLKLGTKGRGRRDCQKDKSAQRHELRVPKEVSPQNTETGASSSAGETGFHSSFTFPLFSVV